MDGRLLYMRTICRQAGQIRSGDVDNVGDQNPQGPKYPQRRRDTYIRIYIYIYICIFIYVYVHIPRRSKYPIFEVSGSNNHTLDGIWDQNA